MLPSGGNLVSEIGLISPLRIITYLSSIFQCLKLLFPRIMVTVFAKNDILTEDVSYHNLSSYLRYNTIYISPRPAPDFNESRDVKILSDSENARNAISARLNAAGVRMVI